MKYVWSIVSNELFAGRGHFVNNRFSSIIWGRDDKQLIQSCGYFCNFSFQLHPILHSFLVNCRCRDNPSTSCDFQLLINFLHLTLLTFCWTQPVSEQQYPVQQNDKHTNMLHNFLLTICNCYHYYIAFYSTNHLRKPTFSCRRNVT